MANEQLTLMNALQIKSLVVQERRWSRLFIISAGVLLLVTGAVKIVSVFGGTPVLGKPDPIFGIPFNYLLLFVGLIELVVAVLCLTTAKQNLSLGLVAALSTNFLIYRTALWLVDWQGYCPCLGTLTQAVHLSHHSADLLARAILIYLLLGSFFFLAYSWGALIGKHRYAPDRSDPTAFSDSSSYGG